MTVLLVLLALLLAAPLAAGQSTLPGRNVFSMDCNGGVHMLTGTQMEMNWDLSLVQTLANLFGEAALDKARCACPGAPDSELRTRFVPSIEWLFSNAMEEVGPSEYAPYASATQNSCPGSGSEQDPVFGLLNAAPSNGGEASGPVLPSTCTPASLQSGQGCQMRLQGNPGNAWLKDASSTLHIFADSCNGAGKSTGAPSEVWPFVSITCEGPGCDDYIFVQPCISDADCATDPSDPESEGAQACRPFFPLDADILSLAAEIGFSDAGGSCSSAGPDFSNFADAILGIVGLPAEDPMVLKVCTSTVGDWARRLYKVGSGLGLFGAVAPESGESDGGVVDALLDFLPLAPFVGSEVRTEFDLSTPGSLPPSVAAAAAGFDKEFCAARGCHASNLGDGYCNPACNVAQCLYDGNECAGCECVVEDDFSGCPASYSENFFRTSFGGGISVEPGLAIYIPGLHAAARPREDNVCKASDPGNPEVVLNPVPWTPVDPSCASVPLGAGSPDYYCTFGAVGDPTTLPPNTLLLLATDYESSYNCSDGDESFPRVRSCFCSVPADESLCGLNAGNLLSTPSGLYSFAGLALGVAPALCDFPSPVEDACPDLVTRASVPAPGLALPGTADGAVLDRLLTDLPRPELVPAQHNVAYMTCDGDLVANLLNPLARAGVSWPGAGGFFAALAPALDALDACTASAPRASATARAASMYVWQPSFWAHALSPTAGGLGGRVDWLGDARFEDESTFFSFPNASALDPGNFGTADGRPAAPVSVRFSALQELFGAPVLLQAAAEGCAGAEPLSSFALALDSPLATQLFGSVRTCTDVVADDCGDPNLECVDLAETVGGIFGGDGGGEEGQGPSSGSSVAGVRETLFDTFLYGETRTAANTCGAAADGERGVLQFLRNVVVGVVGGRGPQSALVRNAALPAEQLLLVCVPRGIEALANARGAEVQCLRNDTSGELPCMEDTLAQCELAYSAYTQPNCSAGGAPDLFRNIPFFFGSPVGSPASELTSCPNLAANDIVAQARRCDEALCARVSTMSPDFADVMEFFSGGTLIDGATDSASFVSAVDQCNTLCNENRQGPLPPDAFYTCIETAACSNDIPDARCFRWLATNLGGPFFQLAPIGAECNEAFPIGGAFQCCSDVLCTFSVAASCASCSDFLVRSFVDGSVTGPECENPGFTLCDDRNEVLFWEDGTSGVAWSPPLPDQPNTVEQCLLECVFLGCTCTYASQATCATVIVGVTCAELEPPSEGFQWLEDQFPEGALPVIEDRVALNVLVEAGRVPASLYTLPAPRLLSAAFDDSGVGFALDFDAATTQTLGVGGGVSGACNGVLQVVGAEDEGLVCAWANATRLLVQVGGGSLIAVDDVVRLVAGNGIRAAPQQPGDLSREATGEAPIAFFGVAPTPVVSVSGASLNMSPCQEELQFLGVVTSGAAGRGLTWSLEILDALLPSVLDGVGAQRNPLLLYSWRGSVLDSPTPFFRVRVTGTNWLGVTGTSALVLISMSSSEVPQVTISGPASRTVRRGLDSPLLSATTVFLCESGPGAGGFQYTWEYIGVLPTLVPPSYVPIPGLPVGPSSKGKVALPKLFAPAGSYRVRVTAAMVGNPSATSFASADVTVTTVPPVMVASGGLQRTVFASQPVSIDFSRSCDPSVLAICDSVFGAPTPGNPLEVLFGMAPTFFTWSCQYRASAGASPTACTGAAAGQPPELRLDLNGGALAPGLYEFSVTLGLLSPRTSPTVRVTVLPALPAACTVSPQVFMSPVDDKLTVSNAGVLLRGDVSGYVPGGAGPVRLLWQRVEGGVPQNDTSFAPVRNRRSLKLSPSALVPGQSYTFRLTAEQACTAPNHAFGEVTFTVNLPPISGTVAAATTTGFAYETIFSLAAQGFSDTDGDDPLEYAFEYTFRRPSGAVAASELFSLSGFAPSPTLRTSLELPPGAAAPGANASVWVTAVARDALGAVSARTGFLRITLKNPVASPQWTPPVVSDALRSTTVLGGQTADVLRTALGLASLANSAGATNSTALREWAASTRSATLALLRNASQETQARPDPNQLALEVSVLQTVLGNPEAVGALLQTEALDFLNGLLERANSTVVALRRSDADPTAVAILPPQLNTDVLESLNALLAAARATIDGARSLRSARRRMQATDAACGTADGARDAVRELARLLASTVDAGAGELTSQSTGIQLSVAREAPGVLGSGSAGGDGLSALSLPPPTEGRGKGGSSSSSSSSGGTTGSRGGFVLPDNVLGGIDFGATGGAPDTVDVVAASFAFNIRCEQARAPVVTFSDVDDGDDSVPSPAPASPPVDNDCDGLVDGGEAAFFNYTGPVTEITDVVSLEFVNSAAPDTTYDPTELPQTIRVTVPSNGLLARGGGGDVCNRTNVTETACGYFDAALGDWSSAGCALAADQGSDASVVVCECNHASDYSVWQAFTSDVRSTFTDPITAITSVALLLLGVIFPTVLAMWLVGVFWAQRKDKLDADKIQKGAIGVMFLQRMQMRAKQKQFFANLREMVAEGRKVDELESYQHMQRQPKNTLASRLNPFGRGLCWNFLLAIRYEHSLLGLVRFDPHYSRAQRVSVFIAIVMGNMLAASIFFELKTAKDVSIGFLIGTVILTSLFVSVPVRILIKTLFRASANRAGSRSDRVSNIFRVASKLSDAAPASSAAGAETDFDLLLAYRGLYAAKRDVIVLRARIAMHKKARRSAGRAGAAAAARERQSASVDPKHMSVFAFTADGRPLDPELAQGAGGAAAPRATALSSSSGEADSQDDSPAALEAQLAEAQEAVAGAKKQLLDKTRAAQTSWRDVPTDEAIKRINRIRNQKSVLLRMSALLADEALPVGKPRRPKFSSAMTYVAWGLLMAFYALSVFYTSRFVLSRADRVGAGEEENEILLLWLFTAALGVLLGYVVAEPAIFFVRFALTPYFVLRFGNAAPSELSDADVREIELEEGVSGDKGFDAERYRYEKNKALKAGKEKEKESSRDAYILEMAADLIEAGF